MKGLSNLAMKPNEDMRDLINRITDTMVIIKESYSNYQNKVLCPHHDLNGGWLDATGEKYKSDTVNNLMNFLKMQLFRAAHPNDIRNVVLQKDPDTITLAQMYGIATTTQRESTFKKISAIENTDETNLEDNCTGLSVQAKLAMG